MITVISPDYFKTIPWKNGLGSTTELAISSGSTLDDFKWRLSIASVANDGVFSDFSGYQRDLVLIEGQGITLIHDDKKVDKLSKLLEVAHFDGGCQTHGSLCAGTIKDFNIMVQQSSFQASVKTYVKNSTITLTPDKNDLVFIYSLASYTNIKQGELQQNLPTGYLARIDPQDNSQQNRTTIQGEQLIVITLTPLT